MIEEASRHLAGILDRDQRTVKFYLGCDKCAVSNYFNKSYEIMKSDIKHISPVSHRSFPRRTSPHSTNLTRNNEYFCKTLQRLKHVLFVGAYLAFVIFPSSSSAPATHHRDTRMAEMPKWIYPCGHEVGGDQGHSGPITDSELVVPIIDITPVALNRARHIKDEFDGEELAKRDRPRLQSALRRQAVCIYNFKAESTFNQNFYDLHRYWKEQNYDWLPNIPKMLEQPLSKNYLNSLKLDETLLDVYEYLQRVAVGMEQLVWDQQARHGKFKENFETMEYDLKNELCEVLTAIKERNLQTRPDISRSIMPESLRSMDNTETKKRDWIIFREYMNVLEYVSDTFTHLRGKK